MANEANVTTLIDLLKSLRDDEFNISSMWRNDSRNISYNGFASSVHSCNTAACVAGWAVFCRGGTSVVDSYGGAAEYLGVEGQDDKGNWNCDLMFEPGADDRLYRDYQDYPELYTREKAIKMLENFRDTSKVVWDVVRP